MASACSSSKSLPKSCVSNAGTIASGNRPFNNDGCSKKPSCILQRKKPVNPLSVSIRPPKVDAVRQRVKSARMLKIRNLQSQLNDANFHLMELAQENRALKSTQRRQVKALNNYEGAEADLPKLIQSHGEENRVLQERNRTLKRQLREVTDTLKVRDDELLAAKDQLKQLTILAKDKQLEERAQLRANLNEAKDLIKSYESEISILNRKLTLEVKNCRQKLNAEIREHKKCQQQLALALGGAKQTESKTRLLGRRFDNSPVSQRKSTSNLSASTSKDTLDSEVKLEPIKKLSSAESRNSLTSPVEKIKARLSTSDARNQKLEDFSNILEKLNLEEEHLKKSLQAGIKTKLKPTKLDTLVQKRNAFQRHDKEDKPSKEGVSALSSLKHTPKYNPSNMYKEIEVDEDRNGFDSDNNSDESPRMADAHHQNGTYKRSSDEGSRPLSESEDVLEHHVQNLKKSERDIQHVQDEMREIEKLEEQIDKNKEIIILKREDRKIADELWNNEFSFKVPSRKNSTDDEISDNSTKGKINGDVDDGNHTTKNPTVALENKKKLLAALREIDNGNSIEQDTKKHHSADIVQSNNIEIDSRKSRLMKELFG